MENRKINGDAIKLSIEHWIQIDNFQVSSDFSVCWCFFFLLRFEVYFRFSWLQYFALHFPLTLLDNLLLLAHRLFYFLFFIFYSEMLLFRSCLRAFCRSVNDCTACYWSQESEYHKFWLTISVGIKWLSPECVGICISIYTCVCVCVFVSIVQKYIWSVC